MYDTAEAALKELQDFRVFERVVCRVLEGRYPGLRPTSATNDLARDGYVRPPFGTGDDLVLWISLQGDWRSKLRYELGEHGKRGRDAKAVFATSERLTEGAKEESRRKALAVDGVELEIVDRAELVHLLERDELRRVAESELGVRPRVPDTLVLAESHLKNLADHRLPGMTAPLVGGDTFAAAMRSALGGAERVVVVEGAGGIGKTRQVLDAALAYAPALVLPTGAPLKTASFATIPLDNESVLIIDDAHRCTGLGALASLLADPRFAPVRLVLVARPRLGDQVRRQAGIESYPVRHLSIEPMNREDVDSIITGRGIVSEEFRRHVIDIAEGNPLLVHTACDLAMKTGTFGWRSASDLLATMVQDRLGGDGAPTRPLRAVAVALAVRGVAGNAAGHGVGDHLAEFAGTITGLPADAGRLEELAGELADRGLAAGPPYTLRPHLAAPVILGHALRGDEHVRLDVPAALDRLAAFGRREGGWTGEGLSWADVYMGSRLADLAVAVRDSADPELARRLSKFVRSLLPEPAEPKDWSVVVALAERVVLAVPGIVADLHTALVKQWPLSEEPDLYDTGFVEHWRGGHENLARRFTTLAGQADEAGQPGAVAAVLDLAYLCDTVGPGLVPLAQIAQWRLTTRLLATDGPDELMALRRERLEAIAQWARDRTAEPPDGLWPYEATRRGPATIARILLAALAPLLSGFVTSTRFSAPQDPNAHVVRHTPLPDHPDLRHQLADATTLVADLLDQPDLRRPCNLPVLLDIVGIPGALRRAADSKLIGSGRPLPAHVQRALADAAAMMSTRIAGSFAGLPLAARRRALEGAVRPGCEQAAQAAAQDPVAVAAYRDPVLRRLLIVQPPHTTRTQREREADRWRAQATVLAGQVSTDEAFELLEACDSRAPATSALQVFARAVGAAADPDITLAFLDANSVAGEEFLLAGTADHHPDLVWAWLTDRMDSQQRIPVLALAIADDHPGHEPQLLDGLTQALPDVPDSLKGTPLGQALARHLLDCRRPITDRLDRLATIGLRGPTDVLPQVLNAIGLLLDALPAGHNDPGLTARCMAVAERTLTEAAQAERWRTNPRRDKDGAASGAELVAGHQPAAFARLLAAHFATGRQLPLPWENTLRDLPTDVREVIAVELLDHWPPPGKDPAPDRHAAHGLTAIARDTHAWDAAVRRWAQGPPRERRRAAEAVHSEWATATWSTVVPALLRAGIDERATTRLKDGLTSAEFTRDLFDTLPARREALHQLSTHPHTAVRDFVTRADAALSRLPDTLEGS